MMGASLADTQSSGRECALKSFSHQYRVVGRRRATFVMFNNSTRFGRRSASTSSRLNTRHSRRNLPTKSPRSHHSHHSLRNRASSLYSRGRDRGRRDRGRRGRDRRSLRSRSRRDRGRRSRRDRGRRHGQQVVCPARMFWGFLCRRHRTSPLTSEISSSSTVISGLAEVFCVGISAAGTSVAADAPLTIDKDNPAAPNNGTAHLNSSALTLSSRATCWSVLPYLRGAQG